MTPPIYQIHILASRRAVAGRIRRREVQRDKGLQPECVAKTSSHLKNQLYAGKTLQIQQADLDTAMDGFSSASSWGLGKGSPSSTITGWQDVGGMEAAKAALQEALELPLKFSKLLSK